MVRETMAFGDHHRYTRRDVERIAAAVAAARADVVLTTAKDAARLRPLRPLPVRVGVLPLTVSVEPAAAFEAWLFGRLRARSS
jgi:tetraacyldisaccharide 4'-kinase